MTESLMTLVWLRARQALGGATLVLSAIALLTAPVPADAQVQGGEVVNAVASGPNSLDPHISANSDEIQITNHIYEGLVAMDENFNPAASLASSFEVSEDSTVFTFTLREGVLFHNGEEMTSADVLASFERYRELSTNSAALGDVASFDAPDDYTFVITLNNPNAVFLEILKTPRQMFAIVPASEADKPVNEMEIIGTGPFRFVEWARDSHILLERFDDYVPNASYEGPDGYAGNRTVHVDRVRFAFVPEPQTRVAGIQAGDFHNTRGFPAELRARFDGDESVTAEPYAPVFQLLFPLNAGYGPTADPLIRQAIRAVVSVEDIMTVATGGNYEPNHSMLYPTSALYPGEATEGFYDVNDVELAESLLQEAGYGGEEIIVMGASNFPEMRDSAVMISELMRAAGMNVNLQIVDWATNSAALGGDEGTWHVSAVLFGSQPLLGPTQWRPIVTAWPNYGEDDVMDQGYAELLSASTEDERREAWTKVERHIFEQAYFIKGGDTGTIDAWRNSLRGYQPWYLGRYWDVWIEE